MLIDEESGKKIILAKNAKDGEKYLVAGIYYEVVIIKKYSYDDEGKDVSSVLVKAEKSPIAMTIAPGTELIEYKKSLHKELKKEDAEIEEDENKKKKGTKKKLNKIT